MEHPTAQPEPEAKHLFHARTRLAASVRAVGPVVRPAVPVALCGYAVLALFGVAYWIAASGWPGLSEAGSAAVASLVAAPVVLGLLWHRLTGLKALGFEVSLSQVRVNVDPGLASAVTCAPHTDNVTAITRQIERAIARPDTELIEVNLRDGDHWWATRLFLLAALADDFSAIRQLVFVEGGVKRTFVGFATPAAVRKALATGTDGLETAYRNVTEITKTLTVAHTAAYWTTHLFGSPQVGEKEFTSVLSSANIHDALGAVGQPLMTASVEWEGLADSRLVRSIVRDFETPYVALLRSGALDRVVNRFELATRIAVDAMMH